MSKRITNEKLNVEMSINGVNKTQAEISKIQTSIRGLEAANKDLAAAKRKEALASGTQSEKYKSLDRELKKNGVAIDDYKKKQSDLQKQIGLTGMTMRQLVKQQNSLKAQMNNFVPGTPEWKKLNAELQETKSRLGTVRGEMNQTEGVMGRMKKSLGGFGGMLLGGAGLMAAWQGVKKFIGANSELSDSLANVRKTTGLTDDQVNQLDKNLRKFNTRTPVNELLALAEEAGRLGKDSVKDIEEFVRTADKISVALGDDLQGDINENVQLIGKLTTQYKVAEKYGGDFGKGMERIGSAINEVAASGANQAGFLVDYLKRLVGVSSQTSITADEQLGFAAALDEAGQSVETSGTTMSKLIVDMFSNVADYAKIAGMETKEFSTLLKEDTNEALLLFLEGLQGNGEGLEVMTKKMDALGVESGKGVAVLTTLAASTDLVRERQETANKAIIEATSLTDEFNVKNDNLAGTLQKIGNVISNSFKSGALGNTLNSLIKGFGELTGLIDDNAAAFARENKQTFESAKANRRLATESSALLSEYESLTRDGVIPTADEKARLEIITLRLRDRLGESVMSIDKETGAFILNTEAVKEQIKQKRLAADDEASTLASRLSNTQDEIGEIKERQKIIRRDRELNKKAFEEENKQNLEAIENSSALTSAEKLKMKMRLEGFREYDTANQKLLRVNKELSQEESNRIDLISKLKELNYSEEDVNAAFGTNSEEPSEGEEKTIGGQLFKFKGGQWIIKKVDGASGGGGLSPDENKRIATEAQRKREQYAKEEDNLTALIQRKREEREIAQLAGLEKELAGIDETYRREIERAEGHSDRILELEALREQEKADAKIRLQEDYNEKAAQLDAETQKLKEEAELDREIAAAETQIEKDQLRLEHARSIALSELEIMMEAELAKVEAVENAEQLKAAIRENYAQQGDKINRVFADQENKLKEDQVKWTELTEDQKLSAVTGALASAAAAFNEGSAAWKAVKISETLIATYQSAQNAYAALAGIPLVGPALGAAAAGLAVVAGMKQVDKIRSTPLEKVKAPRSNVRGYEDGLYKDVTRTDGKRFRARNMGRTRTQVVNEPSYFNDYLTGEAGPELIVDSDTFRRLDPKVVQHIMDVRHNVRGFESGKYPGSASGGNNTTVINSDPELKAMMAGMMNLLQNPPRPQLVWGYEEVEKNTELQTEIQQSKNNGKLTP